jgi:alkylation response protein AidB-like acyl-CoA dehydrogenase
MDFNLTEDRRMLSDTLTRYLDEQYQIEHRNSVAYDAPYHDPSKWTEMAELGVFSALADEAVGGFGGAGADIAVVFEALGRAINCEPALPLLMASRLLSAAGQDQAALLEGTERYAVAISEPDAPYDLVDISTTASDDHRLSGRKTSVYGGNIADHILVAAKAGDRLNLYQVQATEAEIISYGLIDGGGAAEVLLDNTKANLLIKNAQPALQDALDAGIVALCSEAVGMMDVTFQMTMEYLRQRKQFGRPIGTFQALQHRAVDMLTEIEQSRSITIKAASELGDKSASRYASMAKNMIGRSARLVSEEAIQTHGGIAMTWEYSVSHYAKRLIMLDHQLGDTDYHLNRIMAELNET